MRYIPKLAELPEPLQEFMIATTANAFNAAIRLGATKERGEGAARILEFLFTMLTQEDKDGERWRADLANACSIYREWWRKQPREEDTLNS